MAKIRDVSVYDGVNIDYSAYDGFIIRCFNGNVKDTLFETHKAGAKNANKPWWVYMFFNFLYPVLPQIQAVIEILKGGKGCLPLAIDVEEWGGHRFPPRDILLSYLQVLVVQYKLNFGENPQIYLNPATIHYLKPIPAWLLSCLLWIANWDVQTPDYEPWNKWTFWQYKSVAGEDFNKFNGTDEEYLAYVNVVLPNKIRTIAGSLYVRKTPAGTIAGYVPYHTILGVIGEAYDSTGYKWWKVGDQSYVGSSWCEAIN